MTPTEHQGQVTSAPCTPVRQGTISLAIPDSRKKDRAEESWHYQSSDSKKKHNERKDEE